MKKLLWSVLCAVLAVRSLVAEGRALMGGVPETALQIAAGKGEPAYSYYEEREGLLGTRKDFFVRSGKELLGPFDFVGGLDMAPDGQSPMFRALAGEDWFYYIGGQRIGPFAEGSDPWPRLSKGRGNMYLAAHVGADWYAYTAKGRFGPYGSLGNYCEFSPDGRSVAYSATKDGKARVYLDGREMAAFDKVGLFGFRPSDGSLWYSGRIGAAWFLASGARKLGPYEALMWGGEFETVSREPVFQSREQGGWFFRVGDERWGPYDAMVNRGLEKPEAPFPFVALAGGKAFVVNGRSREGPYDECLSPTLSPDGKVLAYFYRRGEAWYLRAGKDEAGPFDDLRLLLFSPDGKKLSYWAQAGKEWYLRMGNQRMGPFAGPGVTWYSAAGELRYTAFVAEGQISLFLGAETIGPFADLAFDEDFRANPAEGAYMHRDESGCFLVHEGKRFGPYESISSDWRYSPDKSRLAFCAWRDGKPCLVVDGAEWPLGSEDYGLSSIDLEWGADSRALSYMDYDGEVIRGYVLVGGKRYVGILRGGEVIYAEGGRIVAE